EKKTKKNKDFLGASRPSPGSRGSLGGNRRKYDLSGRYGDGTLKRSGQDSGRNLSRPGASELLLVSPSESGHRAASATQDRISYFQKAPRHLDPENFGSDFRPTGQGASPNSRKYQDLCGSFHVDSKAPGRTPGPDFSRHGGTGSLRKPAFL